MNEKLIDFFRNPNLNRVLLELEKKYFSYGEIKGSFSLANMTLEEIRLISSLGFIVKDEKIKISINKLLDALNLDKEELKFLVENALDRKLLYNTKEKESQSLEKEEKLTKLLESLKNKEVKEYFLKNPMVLNLAFIDNLAIILDKLDKTKFETLGSYGGRLLGDPHILDYGSKLYNQLVNYLKFNQKITWELSLEEEKELLFSWGLYGNPLNTFITIRGFEGLEENKEKSMLLSLSNTEDINLNLSNILRLKEIYTKNNNILILENPNAYISIKDFVEEKNISLICTGGQLNQSAYVFLNKLITENKKVYYSGDIDPEGILIAQNIKKRFPFIKLIAFNLDIYEKYKSEMEISEKSIKKLNNIKFDEDIAYELVEALEKEKKPCYQELFWEEILKIID